MRIVKRSSGRGSGSTVGYKVEARTIDLEGLPEVVRTLADGHTVLCAEWREVEFACGSNPAGVPCESRLLDGAEHGLLPYESAVALAWTVIAQNRHATIECRLVRHRLSYSYSIEREGYVDGVEIKFRWHRDIKVVDDVAKQPEAEDMPDEVAPDIAPVNRKRKRGGAA